MGRRTSYPPGTFSWVELATTDAAAASRFYRGVFGWEPAEDDAGGGGFRATCRLDGDAVCAITELTGAARAPATWLNYVTVASADAAAARAAEVGGEVVEPARDVGNAGRVAVLGDPDGAVVAVWQPGARMGAERVNDVGCLCMNELVATDVEAACAFYERLFGWTADPSGAEADGPVMVLNDGNVNAAVFAAPPGTPAHWRPCFTVESTARAVARVRELGGRPVDRPLDIGHGSIALAYDPQGAEFTMFAGETEP